LFGIIGKFEEAHEHLDRAQVLMTRLKDNVHLGQVDETRARVLLAEGRTVEAEKTARAAVRTLEKGDELSLLAEALTTHGIALVRLDHSDQARASLERAIAVAEQVGDFESAGVSALTIIELLGASLSNEEVWATIDHVGVLLEKTQEPATLRRLATAFRSLFITHAIPAPPDWKGFSFWDAVHRYEGYLIRLALKETGGKVTAAARILGFAHHQSLISLISSRHQELIETGARAPIRKRRHHLLEHPKRKRKQQ
jgi:tetratricopeptide (TPR) repeat protein